MQGRPLAVIHYRTYNCLAVSQAWRVARIYTFEQVPVSPTTGLLRVGAVTDTHAVPGDPRPALLADDGLTVTRFAALPAPDDTGGTLRSAYSAPVEIVSAETVFSLEFEDGLVIALPAPTLLVALASAQPAADAGLSPAPAPDWWDLFASLLLEAAQARAELRATRELALLGAHGAQDPHAEYVAADVEARIAEAAERADSAMLELAAERDLHEDLRDRYARVEAQLREPAAGAGGGTPGARLAELEVWSGELERRLTEATTALAEARTAAEHDDADLRRLHGELAETRTELELFQTQGIDPASEVPVRPLPGAPRAPLSPAPSELDEIRRDAVREADRRADRDLADAGC